MTEKQWAAMFRYIWPTGVMAVAFNDSLNQLNVTPDASQALTLDVDTGAAGIQGFAYINDAIKTITLAQNVSSGIRADLIVLELKWGLDAGIHAVAITGDNGAQYPSGPQAGQPMPKELVTVYEVKWQIPLCQINVPQGAGMLTNAMITDLRKFVGSGAAQAYAVVVAMGNASDKMRQNADFQIPANAGYVDADTVINEAFDALPACGGTVLLSEGDCITNGSLTPPANSILAGCGSQTTITLAPGVATPVIHVANAGVEIHDLSLIGNATTFSPASPPAGDPACNGIFVDSVNSVNINNVDISYAKGSGISVRSNGAAYLSNIDITDCGIGACYSDGIVYAGNYGLIKDNIISNVGGDGISLAATGAESIAMNLIANNRVTGCGNYGMSLYSGPSPGTLWYNTISGNQLDAYGLRNLGSGGYAGIIIVGAHQDDNTGCSHNSFMANHLWGGTHYGLYISTGTAYMKVIGNDLYDSSTGNTANNLSDNGSNTVGVSLNLKH